MKWHEFSHKDEQKEEIAKLKAKIKELEEINEEGEESIDD